MDYGRLTIMYFFKKKKYKMVHCRCLCGNETDVYYSNLKAGRTRSCGCLEKENRHKYKNLTNHRFGELTALSPTNERIEGCVVWNCQCSCGVRVKKSAKALLKGDVKSCGCLRKFKKTKYDLISQAKTQYTVLFPLTRRMNWETKWLCQCKCGKKFESTFSNLYFGHTRSCGCLKNKEYRTLVDGTVIECLSTKINRNNTSGIKGVYRARNKWVAYITFKGKRHYLGYFDDINDARLARLKGEEKYFAPLLNGKKDVM